MHYPNKMLQTFQVIYILCCLTSTPTHQSPRGLQVQLLVLLLLYRKPPWEIHVPPAGLCWAKASFSSPDLRSQPAPALCHAPTAPESFLTSLSEHKLFDGKLPPAWTIKRLHNLSTCHHQPVLEKRKLLEDHFNLSIICLTNRLSIYSIMLKQWYYSMLLNNQTYRHAVVNSH